MINDQAYCVTFMMDEVVLHDYAYWKLLFKTKVNKILHKEMNINVAYLDHCPKGVSANPQRGTNNSKIRTGLSGKRFSISESMVHLEKSIKTYLTNTESVSYNISSIKNKKEIDYIKNSIYR